MHPSRNYDALQAKDYVNAYGPLPPTLDDIDDALSRRLLKEGFPAAWKYDFDQWREDAHRVFNDLKDWGILQESGGRWNVTF